MAPRQSNKEEIARVKAVNFVGGLRVANTQRSGRGVYGGGGGYGAEERFEYVDELVTGRILVKPDAKNRNFEIYTPHVKQ